MYPKSTWITTLLALTATVSALPQPQAPSSTPNPPTALSTPLSASTTTTTTPTPVDATILPDSPFSKEEVEIEHPSTLDKTSDYTALFPNSSMPESQSHPSSNQKRHTLTCEPNPKKKGALRKRVKDGIQYLRKREGKPELPPGKCAVVSCSWGDAINWCNWGPKEFTLPSYNFIADSAQAIFDDCYDGHSKKPFGGWVDHADHWTVLINGDKDKDWCERLS
ncbi:uncharacterized protein BDV14DRAFT_202167 [Aspergillus stella-maris]|uniref:uncharacterized protein n=1 Tax=Aspergillus stella-maris TaxID=1810926 RepID=UPI003CCDD4DF